MTKRWTAALLALLLATSVAACGDDDPPASSGDETEAADGSDASASAAEDGGDGAGESAVAAACTANIEISKAFSGEPDPAVLNPLFDELEATAPDEIADAVGVQLTAARGVLETGDFSAFESPEFAEATARADAYWFEECEADEKLEVRAVDYAFTGLPAEIGAGMVFVKLANESESGDPHEILVMRKADGETATWDELFELGEEASAGRVEFVGAAFAEPGGMSVAYLDLTPGEYVAVCFVPVGGGEDGEGVPNHHDEGMVQEFTVS